MGAEDANNACIEFIAHIREEKLKQQDRRAAYIRLKFTFVIALFSVAATLTRLKPEDGLFYIYGLLYIAPIVAILLDFYILGGSFAVGRIRAFLSRYDSKGDSESIWENYVEEAPKGFMITNRLWVTNFIFAASAIPIIRSLYSKNTALAELVLFAIWVVVLVGLSVYLISIERDIKNAFYNKANAHGKI